MRRRIPRRHVRCASLEVVDPATGITRAVVGPVGFNSFGVGLHDDEGRERALLVTSDHGTALTLATDEGNDALALGVENDGRLLSYFHACDRDGTPKFLGAVKPNGRLRVKATTVRAALGASARDVGVLGLAALIAYRTVRSFRDTRAVAGRSNGCEHAAA